MSKPQIRSYRDLEVWRAAMDLVVLVYRLAVLLPANERFELSAQIRRAAVSIPSNIAEGHARRGKSYRYHVVVALGSTAELETQIEVAARLGFVAPSDTAELTTAIASVGQMLHGLKRSLDARNRRLTAGLTLLACVLSCLFLP
jgi:four helix bundle protein